MCCEEYRGEKNCERLDTEVIQLLKIETITLRAEATQKRLASNKLVPP